MNPHELYGKTAAAVTLSREMMEKLSSFARLNGVTRSFVLKRLFDQEMQKWEQTEKTTQCS